MSNAVARQDQNRSPAPAAKRDKVEGFRSSLVKFEPTIASVLPAYVKPERVIALGLTAATKNPKLFECTMESVALALIQVAQWDLEIGRTAHLVPFGNTCTAIADWKGLVELMLRSGHVKDVKARAVYSKEYFRVTEGLRADLEHTPSYDTANRGDLMAFYAVAFLARGGGTFEVMTKEDVDKIRSRARSKDSEAWVNHYVEMGKKTAIRRLAKRMPQTPSLQSALSTEDRLDAGELLEVVQRESERLRMSAPSSAPSRARSMLPAPSALDPHELDTEVQQNPREVTSRAAAPFTDAQRATAEAAARSQDPYVSGAKSDGGGVGASGSVGNGQGNAPGGTEQAPMGNPTSSSVTLPFNQGKSKAGTPLGEVSDKDLADAVRFADGVAKYAAFVEQATEELERRRLAANDADDPTI